MDGVGAVFELALAQTASLHVLPEMQAAIQAIISHAQQRLPRLNHLALIPQLQTLLGDTEGSINPFASAWTLMYITAGHLDHFQDGDTDPLLERWSEPSALIYTKLLGSLCSAQALLTTLSNQLPAQRVCRLHTAWSMSCCVWLEGSTATS